MQFRNLGKSELKISTIVMGTFQAGREKWVDIDDTQSIGAIRAAFEAGVNTFDSAEAYGKGHSERILGTALADLRDQVVLATKVCAPAAWQQSRVRLLLATPLARTPASQLLGLSSSPRTVTAVRSNSMSSSRFPHAAYLSTSKSNIGKFKFQHWF